MIEEKIANKTVRQLLIEKDEVSLCDFDGKIIGREDKYAAHKYPSQLHLAISIWLFNSQGKVLLQKRSKKKIVGADWWANTVCGNVWPTETFYDCAIRRLKVELGIVSGFLITPVYKFAYKAYGNEIYGEHELDQVYVGMYEGEVTPNQQEVSEFCWVDFQELFRIASIADYISADQSLFLDAKELKEKTPPMLLAVDGRELDIAPWTLFMLKTPQLFDAFKQVLKTK